MSINYDFGDLEAFLAVKHTNSFHAAAEQLNLSQSAVTRRIRKLELALDSVLFERTTRAVKPTLAAKRLQARAEAILDDARETARAMRDESVAFAHQRGAVVTLAAIPSVLGRLILPALCGFRTAGHATRLRLLDGSANEVAEAVTAGEADFGLCPIPLTDPQTMFEPLFDDPMVLALPTGHSMAGAGNVDWRALAEIPLILPARGTGNRLLIDEAMAKARLPLRWTYEVGRTSTALDMVAGGFGAAPLPRSAVGSALVAVCELAAPEITRPVGFLSRIGQSDTAAVVALKTAIRSAV
ncbi:LysR family transcriptional regulator [Ruegeria sp. 2205SS24-7]|uniref:LysR family transcriptional regulator n=1 Tax=Ruegeria discodermiae TaxID=3064389 RepID=UPI0027428972|nr:LysR family transcriptional regulator [Ruegeria sp. 2205SS24-7]MDP5219180.1 LysR family transcriptional regulator [Ruegeria sp. 2205SS24-7]